MGWISIFTNCRPCRDTLVESINTNMELEMNIIGVLRSADQYCSLCNGGWIHFFTQGESQEKEGDTGWFWTWKQDKDSYYLRPLYTNMKRSSIATQCHCGLCWTAEPEQSVKQSRRPVSWMSYAILSCHRKWNVFLCVPDWLCIFQPVMRDSITQWLNVIH